MRVSAAATTDRATAVQIGHCRTSRLMVFSTVWKMLRTADRTSRAKDPPVVMRNVLSAKVSRENAESRSSLDSIQKNRMNSANVTMPMVRAVASPCAWSARLITARVPAAISRPVKASQARIPRVRIGRPGGRGAVHQPGGGSAVAEPDGLDGQHGEAHPQRLQREQRDALGDVEDAGTEERGDVAE